MHYRLYRLDETTGHFVDAIDILAENDDEAIRAGHEACTETPFEIWCQARRVFTPAAVIVPASPSSQPETLAKTG